MAAQPGVTQARVDPVAHLGQPPGTYQGWSEPSDGGQRPVGDGPPTSLPTRSAVRPSGRSARVTHDARPGTAPESRTASYRRASLSTPSQAARRVVTVRPAADIASFTGATSCHGLDGWSSNDGSDPSASTRIASSSGRRMATEIRAGRTRVDMPFEYRWHASVGSSGTLAPRPQPDPAQRRTAR